MTRDWVKWHRDYDDAGTSLSRRVTVVRERLRHALLATDPATARLISMCAGSGHDVIPVLASDDSWRGVHARLVERDDDLAADARSAAARAGLVNLAVCMGDAGSTDAYAGAAPADVLLACGVFGNISDDDVRRTIVTLPRLTAPGGMVIWTRGRRPDDPTPGIRSCFAANGFTELAFVAPPDEYFSVGVHRLRGGAERAFVAGERMFAFR